MHVKICLYINYVCSTERWTYETSAAEEPRRDFKLESHGHCEIAIYPHGEGVQQAVEDQFECMHGMEVFEVWLTTGLADNIMGGSDGGEPQRNGGQSMRHTPINISARMQILDLVYNVLLYSRSLSANSMANKALLVGQLP